jgi:hypothetical protein
MLKLHKDLPKAKTPHEQESLQRSIEAPDKRAALLDLALAMHGADKQRARGRGPDSDSLRVQLATLEDEWKR